MGRIKQKRISRYVVTPEEKEMVRHKKTPRHAKRGDGDGDGGWWMVDGDGGW